MAATASGSLTSAQITAIRADVVGSGDLNALPRTGDGYQAMADLYNAAASPSFTVWRTNIQLTELGEAIDATELRTLPQLDILNLIFLTSCGPIDASLPNRRAFFAAIFASKATSLAALTALAKRLTLRIEKLLATGTGTNGNPGVLGFEGKISRQDIELALANQ